VNEEEKEEEEEKEDALASFFRLLLLLLLLLLFTAKFSWAADTIDLQTSSSLTSSIFLFLLIVTVADDVINCWSSETTS
jgi:hypothetical protein